MDNMIELALMGKLTEREYASVGMRLFACGYASIDPLLDGAMQFPLTQKGRKRAIELRARAAAMEQPDV